MLADDDWEDEYRTGENSPLQKFIIPAIGHSLTYWRASGYFSSSILDAIGQHIGDFVMRGGKMDLVTSVHLSQQDKQAIEDGHKSRNQLVEDKLKEIVENDFRAPLPEGVVLLSKMLEVGALNIKIATTEDGGLFHTKMGVFIDEDENYISFSGSQNESLHSMIHTFEEIDVFTSWNDERRARKKKEWFTKLWDGKANKVVTYDFPEALSKVIVKEAKKTEKKQSQTPAADGNKNQTTPESIGDLDSRYSFQEEAIEWFVSSEGANGSGIYWMATGTGKTITALKTVNRLFDEGLIDSVVLNTKERLLQQWFREMNKTLPGSDQLAAPWRKNNLTFWHTADKKQSAHFRQFNQLNGRLLMITYSFLPQFLEQCKGSNFDLSRTLLIVDEVHNIGSDLNQSSMSNSDDSLESELDEITSATIDIENSNMYGMFGYRLGLSATPFSDFDDNRNEFILSSFTKNYPDITNTPNWSDFTLDQKRNKRIQLYPANNCAFYFGLDDAIKRGILVPFDYLPLEYEPTEEEKRERIRVMKYWKVQVKNGLASPAAPAIHMARVFKGSRDKIRSFKQWLEGLTLNEFERYLKRALIFVDTEEFGFEVSRILHSYDLKYHTFFSGSDEELLDYFSTEMLDNLITCHMISEGVSINSISSIILFSSDRQRLETIQRIGRALRRNPDDPEKIARVLDFVYFQSSDEDSSDAERYRWLTNSAKIRRE